MNKVGYVCLTSIIIWVMIELIVQFGVVNSKNRLPNAWPVGQMDVRAPNVGKLIKRITFFLYI